MQACVGNMIPEERLISSLCYDECLDINTIVFQKIPRICRSGEYLPVYTKNVRLCSLFFVFIVSHTVLSIRRWRFGDG